MPPPGQPNPGYQDPSYQPQGFQDRSFQDSVPGYGTDAAPWGAPAPGPLGDSLAKPIPDGLKVLTIIVTIVKAIPWVISLILVLWGFSAGSDFADLMEDAGGADVGDAVDDVVTGFLIFGLLFLASGALLLFFHLRGALQPNLLTLAVVSGIMTAIDALWVILALLSDPVSVGFVLVTLLFLAAQGTIFGWTLTTRQAQNA